MQVTEISAQGLKRQYKVVLPAADLASKLDAELNEMKGKVRINGFRPGKVPAAHLKRLYGRSLMGDVVQNAVNEANRKIVEDNNLRLALEPKVDLASDQAEVEKAMEAKGDLAFTVELETLPKFEVGSFDDIDARAPGRPMSTTPRSRRPCSAWPTTAGPFTAKTDEGAAAEKGDKADDRLRRASSTAWPSRAARAPMSTSCSAPDLHPGLRRSARRGQARRRAHRSTSSSRRTTATPSSRASTPPSTSR